MARQHIDADVLYRVVVGADIYGPYLSLGMARTQANRHDGYRERYKSSPWYADRPDARIEQGTVTWESVE